MTPTSNAPTRRTLLTGAAAAAMSIPLADALPAHARGRHGDTTRLTRAERTLLRRWATDTWRSLVAMVDPGTGLVSDKIPSTLTGRVAQTSPTNIGGYLWSAVVARDLGIITPGEATRRIRRTLLTLTRMEHHQPSGMYYNWYDVTDGSVLRTWPENGNPVVPFVSSVDSAWIGAALVVVKNAVPGVRKLADELVGAMRWDMFWDETSNAWPVPLIHGGFYAENPGTVNTAVFTGNHIGIGPDVWYTKHHYDTCVSETRMTNYLGSPPARSLASATTTCGALSPRTGPGRR